VVDDFGVKYARKEDLDHLVSAISELYELTIDRQGRKYVVHRC
jgi:hypothetical protein